MNVEYIKFIFENCETFQIAGEDIGDLYIDDIHYHYRRITADFVEKFEYADTFFIEIHKRANELYECFGGPDTMYKFDRLIYYDDVVIVEMKINEEVKTFYLKWENPYKEENPKYQSSLISACGHLYLKVSELNFDDFIDDESINNEKEVHQHFIMLGMGDGFDA